MKPSDIQRARNALKAERSRLSEDRATLANEAQRLIRVQRQLDNDLANARHERAALVAALRSACGRYGDNDWPDTANLADVIYEHLLTPLRAHEEAQRVHLEVANQQVHRLLVDVERAPKRPQALPVARLVPRASPAPSGVLGAPVAHQAVIATVAGGRWRAECDCGWHGAVVDEQAADREARHHLRNNNQPARRAR
jgi:signal transduction histidine kinase